MTSPSAFLSLVAEMHLVFASAEGEEGERERRRREEGGERGREEGGEGEDSLAVCWRLNRMLSHRGESEVAGERLRRAGFGPKIPPSGEAKLPPISGQKSSLRTVT